MLMRRTGFSYREPMEQGVLLPVIEAGASYHASAKYDDVLRIHAEIREIRGVRLAFGYRIERDDGTLLVTGHPVHAFRGRGAGPPLGAGHPVPAFAGRDGNPVRPPAAFRALSLSNDKSREKGV